MGPSELVIVNICLFLGTGLLTLTKAMPHPQSVPMQVPVPESVEGLEGTTLPQNQPLPLMTLNANTNTPQQFEEIPVEVENGSNSIIVSSSGSETEPAESVEVTGFHQGHRVRRWGPWTESRYMPYGYGLGTYG